VIPLKNPGASDPHGGLAAVTFADVLFSSVLWAQARPSME
jgi:hypothetical protein